MNIIRNFVISLGLILLSTPVISGQDLSRYRKIVARNKSGCNFEGGRSGLAPGNSNSPESRSHPGIDVLAGLTLPTLRAGWSRFRRFH